MHVTSDNNNLKFVTYLSLFYFPIAWYNWTLFAYVHLVPSTQIDKYGQLDYPSQFGKKT